MPDSKELLRQAVRCELAAMLHDTWGQKSTADTYRQSAENLRQRALYSKVEELRSGV